MAFTCDRNKESLEWFLFREKLYGDRALAIDDIKKGCITINGKVKKDPEYVVKKKDEFAIRGVPAGGCLVTFTVDE
jgi:ribosomal protein S4